MQRKIYNFKFSKVNALRKRRLGAYSQEETYLKFSQAGRSEAFLQSWSLQGCTLLFSDTIQKTICTIYKNFDSFNISQTITLVHSTAIMLSGPQE